MTGNCLAWQGWRLDLPSRWNPVRIEGDYDQGSVLIADLHRPRLGLRWRKPAKKPDPQKWARQALLDEVGKLAADEAKLFEMPSSDWPGSSLYIEPEPPGRDVWVAYSPVSNRCVEVIHHAHRREKILADSVLPTLSDSPTDQAMLWSVFDLSCESPAGMKLTSHRLNAGDLSLTFEGPRQLLTIRQIALAGLALKRMNLNQWLADQQKLRRKHYRPIGEMVETESGAQRDMVRRRRFALLRSLPRELFSVAIHDKDRDRLILIEASDRALLESAAASVGWASL